MEDQDNSVDKQTATLFQLKNLVVERENALYAINDTETLQNIATLLCHKDHTLVAQAVDILLCLSEPMENRSKLAESEIVTKNLRAVMCDITISSFVRNNASKIYERLVGSKNSASNLPSSTTHPLRNVTNNNNNTGLASLSSVTKDNTKKTSHASITVYKLRIPSMTDLNKRDIETLLVTIPGVISFLLDSTEKTAIVRSQTKIEPIIRELKHQGYSSTLLDNNDKENGPQYLEENVNNESGWFSSLVSFNDKKKNPPSENNGWFGFLKGYIF